MTVVLDSGGITMLARDRAKLTELVRRGEWPPLVPAVVLTESLTGDHRRDFHENRLLRTCDIREVDEGLARSAAALRTRVSGPRPPSAVDAVVVALADQVGGAVIVTSDPADIGALVRLAIHEIRVSPV